MSATADELRVVADFDHPFSVDENGNLSDGLADVWAPAVYGFEGEAAPTIDGSGWVPVSGFSGQDRYSGPVMHSSEYLGGGMAAYVLETPGTYVVVAVEDGDGDEEPWGWMLLVQE